jgi:heavy metal efflux system protein
VPHTVQRHGTDATGFFNSEFFVPLKPFDTGPAGMDTDKLTEQMTERLNAEFPGVDFNFSQYIEDNVGEAASGVKGENSVKLFGGDLEVLEKTASKIKDVMATVPGVQRARPRPRHHDVGGAEEG